MDAGGGQNVFGLSEAQIARLVKTAVRAADLPRLGEFQRSQRASMVQRDAARAPAQSPSPALLPTMYLSLGGGRRNLKLFGRLRRRASRRRLGCRNDLTR